MTGEEIARELVNVLSVEYGIGVTKLLAAMHDRASANTLAMTTIKVLYSNLLDVGCYSHTLDHVGQTFNMPVLNDFIHLWISLFLTALVCVSNGRNLQGNQWHFSVIPDGGVGGKYVIRCFTNLEMCSHS